MSSVIQVENISKQYRLGDIGTGALSHDLNRFWHRMWGKEDPYLKIGETNDRTSKGASEYVWSLKDVSFEIQQGDAVGIIGRNGAGKSTLLKILSRVTAPTTGSIKVRGRIASLLEVGTGFHPDLSGRDNIYLNGAILGMRKHEIKRKFDEIVNFAGVERYIDTPVKRYSSGMYVRLAFAVAAHLESEILIVDEVLAVGDAEFQKKCLGKMNEVSTGEGRTVLFVSHNMGSISSLCKTAILLKTGGIELQGLSNLVINAYVKSNTQSGMYKATKVKDTVVTKVFTSNGSEVVTDQFAIKDTIKINVEGLSGYIKDLKVGIALVDKNKVKIFTNHYDLHLKGDLIRLSLTIPHETICPGEYSFDVALFLSNGNVFDYVADICPITVVETGSNMYYDSDFGSVFIKGTWNEY